MSAIDLDLLIDDRMIQEAVLSVQLLQLTPPKKRRVVKISSKEVIKKSRKNITRQTDYKGKSFAKRKSKNTKKMLINLGKGLTPYVYTDKAVIQYKNKAVGVAAKRQQEGLPQKFTAAKLKKMRGKPNYDDPTTRKQAKLLIELGFTVRRKRGKGRKKPSIKWITENFTQRQFGAIAKELAHKAPKKSWDVTPEPRAFLGVMDSETEEIFWNAVKKVLKPKNTN